ncbi:MAG TPA: xanthine dehydrogenase family protein subunit M [Thermomicrobiales bacterium]|nr:xanthine dehydrogenase family protein subunit M [Thermomicrobiales bacterium]
MRPFAYTRPESIEEALTLLDGETRPLAGGTDLLTLMKGEIVTPGHLVDIKRLPELSHDIAQADGAISLGSLTTLSQIEHDPLIREHLPALGQAASLAATPQLRNMATIGGNVLQRPRCWYYRNDEVTCWLQGGDECYARGGDNRYHAIFDVSPCVAVHPSDMASVLVAYDATIQYRDAGEHEIGVEAFFQPPTPERRTENVLPENAVITGITIPTPSSSNRSVYLKAMDRKVWAFALVGVAISLEMESDTVAKANVVLSGVAPTPVRSSQAEQLLVGSRLDAEVVALAADAAVANAEPLQHNGYKVPLVTALIRQALQEAVG